jgi:hypothetical protein
VLREDLVREIVARKQRGEGIKRIARELWVDRKTVQALAAARQLATAAKPAFISTGRRFETVHPLQTSQILTKTAVVVAALPFSPFLDRFDLRGKPATFIGGFGPKSIGNWFPFSLCIGCPRK